LNILPESGSHFVGQTKWSKQDTTELSTFNLGPSTE